MKENYINREQNCAENTDFRQRFERCESVGRNITIYELDFLYYLRLLDADETSLSFIKKLYKIKMDLKHEVLSAFNIWSLVEPFDYDNLDDAGEEN